MGRYDELTPKARTYYENAAQQIAAEQRQNPRQRAGYDEIERVRERGPPEYPQRGPADDEHESDSIMIEQRARKRRAEMLLERQRGQYPDREP
jgi:hypothetical protein